MCAVALKVMLSSVRRGLADVRDSVAPVLTILKYQVVRFETVTKTPVPARAACVAMVEESDMYLLLLGEEYGDPMPGTDLAPTEEEWRVARNLGRPIVVFKRLGIDPGPQQAAFINRVEDYETGVWRHSFSEAGDLISQIEAALASAAQTLQPVASNPLTSPVATPWLERQRGIYTGAGTVLETHVVPIGDATWLRASSFDDLRRTVTRNAQDSGLFSLGQAIDFDTTEESVAAQAKRDGRQPEAGVRVSRQGAVSIWESLPRSQIGGAVLDEGQFQRRLARDLRLAAALNLTEAEWVAIGTGFNDVSMLGIPSSSGTSLPFAMGGGSPVRLEPSDMWPARALSVGADDIANEFSARLMLRLKVGR